MWLDQLKHGVMNMLAHDHRISRGECGRTSSNLQLRRFALVYQSTSFRFGLLWWLFLVFLEDLEHFLVAFPLSEHLWRVAMLVLQRHQRTIVE